MQDPCREIDLGDPGLLEKTKKVKIGHSPKGGKKKLRNGIFDDFSKGEIYLSDHVTRISGIDDGTERKKRGNSVIIQEPSGGEEVLLISAGEHLRAN